MITICPCDAIRDTQYHQQVWFVVYEHFAKLIEASTPSYYDFLNNTSGQGAGDFHPLYSLDAARRHLVRLFLRVGSDCYYGDFLRSCGIKTWKDLAKPIELRGWQPHRFANGGWFDVDSRRLKVSHNESHSEAIWVQEGALKFDGWRSRWSYRLYYSYFQDPSSWYISLTQNRRESREHFANRVDAWLADTLEPDDRWRTTRLRNYARAVAAYRNLFWCDDSICGDDREIGNLMANVHTRGSCCDGRIRLTDSRRATVLRWAKHTATLAEKGE